jgi:hypothetical protein
MDKLHVMGNIKKEEAIGVQEIQNVFGIESILMIHTIYNLTGCLANSLKILEGEAPAKPNGGRLV